MSLKTTDGVGSGRVTGQKSWPSSICTPYYQYNAAAAAAADDDDKLIQMEWHGASAVWTRLCCQPASSQWKPMGYERRLETHFLWTSRTTRRSLEEFADEDHPTLHDTTTTHNQQQQE